MKLFSKFILLLVMVFPVLASATVSEGVLQAFKFYKTVTPNVSLPTVVEVPFGQEYYAVNNFAVFNTSTKEFEPYLFTVNQSETKVRLGTSGEVDLPPSLNDGNYETYFEFPFEGDLGYSSTINFNFEKPIMASSLNFALDNNVALPQTISISAEVAGRDHVVLAETRLSSGNIVFPKTTSARWQVSFSYVQPLRISEIKFHDLSDTVAGGGLRFLATPRQSYQIYFDADRYVKSFTKESGDLFSNNGVMSVTAGAQMSNSKYKPVDSDADSVPDLSDNCVSVANSDQMDANVNGRGDACEDYDRDGVVNNSDNCRDLPNVGQTDTDDDGAGDVCDDKDNRVTERMPWLPWVGIVFAGVSILGLFIWALRHKKEDTIN